MRFNDILLEYNRDQTVKNYGNKVLAVALKDRSVINALIGRFPNGAIKAGADTPEGQQLILDYVMGVIEQSDPTKNKNYAQAITRMYTLGGTMLEDIESTLSQYLIKFDKLKNKKKIPAPQNDFMRYKSLDEFMSVVEQLPDPDSEIEQQKIGAVQLPPERDWRYVYGRMDEQGRITTDCLIIQPLTKFGGYWWAKEYPKKGVTNRWCTAWEGDNSRFDYYAKQGPLFIIIPANRTDDNEKYQFHFETKQFMDFQDHQIGDEGMDQLAKRFPALQQVFRRQAIQYNLLGLMTDDYKAAVRSHSKVASKELDSLIEQYKERIAGFGFSSLGDYGITIPEDTQRELMPLIENYLEQCRATLVSKDGFWRQVVNKLGTERNEDKLEVILNTDPSLKALVEQSEAGKAVAEIASLPNIKQRIDASHLQDLLLRDPLFRFTMRQVPKLYKSFLDELSSTQVNEEMYKSKKWDTNLQTTNRERLRTTGRNAIRVPGDMSRAVWSAPAWSFQEIAQKLGITVRSLTELGKTFGFPAKVEGITSTYGSKSYYNQTDVKRWVNANDIRNVIKSKQAVDENNEYGDLGDDDGVAEDGFFVVIANENDGVFIGMVTKDGGRWRESEVAGDAPSSWGGNYMSYLTPDDVMQHIRNDYSRHSQVKGPFYSEDQATQYAEQHFDFGSDDDYDYDDDEDTMEEGKMKDIDIGRQDHDAMSPQQFKGQYKQSKDDWAADNQGLLGVDAPAPAVVKAKKPNTVEAYLEVYNSRDQREFKSMPFPSEKAAQRWADSHNAIIHSIVPLKGVAEQTEEPEDDVEHDDGKIAGRYRPDEFDELVNRVKAKAKEQERIHGPVDIAKLAARLRGIQ